MRFLKNKIALAHQFQLKQSRCSQQVSLSNNISFNRIDQPEKSHSPVQPKTRKRIPGQSFTPEKYRSTKNIVKNYGKAISAFALSELATPYILPSIQNEGISLPIFLKFARSAKEQIEGIDSFRCLLVVNDGDGPEVISCKKVFRYLGEVFIKCFSVNWIFHGRVAHKISHLKFRHKMLRRIRNPELFTYLMRGRKQRTYSSAA